MEYTLNNFIGDTLYVLERQNFGTLEFNIPRINSLSYEEAYKFRNTYYIDDMEGEFEADFMKVTPYVITSIVIEPSEFYDVRSNNKEFNTMVIYKCYKKDDIYHTRRLDLYPQGEKSLWFANKEDALNRAKEFNKEKLWLNSHAYADERKRCIETYNKICPYDDLKDVF